MEETKESHRRELAVQRSLRWRRKVGSTYKLYPTQEKNRQAQYRDQLTDAYVFRSFAQRSDIEREDVPDEILDLKRAVMTLKRLLSRR